MGGKRREKAEVESPCKASRRPQVNNAELEDSASDDASFDEAFAEPAASDADIIDESTDDERPSAPPPSEGHVRVPFNVKKDPVGEDEELVADPSAYDMFHHFQDEWPCLSFDIISEQASPAKLLAPQDMTIIGGTQAKGSENSLTIYRCKNLRRTWEPGHSSDESEDDSDSDQENASTAAATSLGLQSSYIRNEAAFNKVVVCPRLQTLVATSTDDAKISVYDIRQHLARIEEPIKFADPGQKPITTFLDHSEEGFGLDWHQESSGSVGFASANRDGKIIFYEPIAGGWSKYGQVLSPSPCESVSWKYADSNVLAAGSCDGNITIYDKRNLRAPAMTLKAIHTGDVNVVAFGTHSENAEQLISGGDDAMIRLTDLRYPEETLFMNRDFHAGPICALDWSRQDYTTFVAGSYDDRCTVWDLSAEGGEIIDGWPCQLIFEHCGQNQIHSVKCHPTIPYMFVSVGLDGFNIWRPEDLFEFAKTLQTNC